MSPRCHRTPRRSAVAVLSGLLLACSGDATGPGGGLDPDCDAFSTESVTRGTPTAAVYSAAPSLTGPEGAAIRNYVWSVAIANACVAADPSANYVDFAVDVTGETGGVIVTGSVSLNSALPPPTVQLVREGNQYYGRLRRIDLTHGSSNGITAAVVVALQFSFPHQGSDANDLFQAVRWIRGVSVLPRFQVVTP